MEAQEEAVAQAVHSDVAAPTVEPQSEEEKVMIWSLSIVRQ